MHCRVSGEKGSLANGLESIVDLRRMPSCRNYTRCRSGCTTLPAQNSLFVTEFKLRGPPWEHMVLAMTLEIQSVSTQELPQVLELNDLEVPHVGKVDMAQMYWFSDHADYFRVARIEGKFAGFLIGLRPGSTYASPNYRWFCQRYPDFAYIDRVAVAADARRHGIASHLYEDFASSMPDSVGHMTCEVNVMPPNEASMRFHLRLGFQEVGTLSHDAGRKKVALMAKVLKQG